MIVKEQHALGNTLTVVQILLDTKTGVNYLFTTSTVGSGLTPLLDENGNVVVDKSIPNQK